VEDRVVWGNWKSIHQQRKYLDWLATKLNFQEQEDFYKLTTKDFIEKGGSPLLAQYLSTPCGKDGQ